MFKLQQIALFTGFIVLLSAWIVFAGWTLSLIPEAANNYAQHIVDMQGGK
jgi:hypothetical protein